MEYYPLKNVTQFYLQIITESRHSKGKGEIQRMTKHRPCIIIPVYNHHRFIDTTLQKTSKRNIAIILVNDGSTQDLRGYFT